METKTIYFWKIDQPYGWLSNWYKCSFQDEHFGDFVFTSVEHYIMIYKATLFNDVESLDALVNETNPVRIKKIGRNIKNFKQETWDHNKEHIAYRGNYLKFNSNSTLKKRLLDTQLAELVEASPFDSIWGIGYSIKDAESNRKNWGSNILGKILMELRKHINKV